MQTRSYWGTPKGVSLVIKNNVLSTNLTLHKLYVVISVSQLPLANSYNIDL